MLGVAWRLIAIRAKLAKLLWRHRWVADRDLKNRKEQQERLTEFGKGGKGETGRCGLESLR